MHAVDRRRPPRLRPGRERRNRTRSVQSRLHCARRGVVPRGSPSAPHRPAPVGTLSSARVRSPAPDSARRTSRSVSRLRQVHALAAPRAIDGVRDTARPPDAGPQRPRRRARPARWRTTSPRERPAPPGLVPQRQADSGRRRLATPATRPGASARGRAAPTPLGAPRIAALLLEPRARACGRRPAARPRARRASRPRRGRNRHPAAMPADPRLPPTARLGTSVTARAGPLRTGSASERNAASPAARAGSGRASPARGARAPPRASAPRGSTASSACDARSEATGWPASRRRAGHDPALHGPRRPATPASVPRRSGRRTSRLRPTAARRNHAPSPVRPRNVEPAPRSAAERLHGSAAAPITSPRPQRGASRPKPNSPPPARPPSVPPASGSSSPVRTAPSRLSELKLTPPSPRARAALAGRAHAPLDARVLDAVGGLDRRSRPRPARRAAARGSPATSPAWRPRRERDTRRPTRAHSARGASRCPAE